MNFKISGPFDQGRHSIALDHEKRLIAARDLPWSDHVRRFHLLKRSEYSQAHHIEGADTRYDRIVSDS